jgi:hypothetical protein
MTYYKFGWKNNDKRVSMYGRTCRILKSGRMGSVLVEFGNGQLEITSRRALRKVDSGIQPFRMGIVEMNGNSE